MAYRDMGVGRSIDKVALKLRKSSTIIARWSGRHEWVTRVEAWDAHLQAEREALEEASRRTSFEADRRKAQASRRAVIKALDTLLSRALAEELKDADTKRAIDKRDLKDLATAARIVFQESRLEFGEPTAIEENRVSGTIATKSADEMTDDELVAYLQASRRA